jgi:hypothetical protein
LPRSWQGEGVIALPLRVTQAWGWRFLNRARRQITQQYLGTLSAPASRYAVSTRACGKAIDPWAAASSSATIETIQFPCETPRGRGTFGFSKSVASADCQSSRYFRRPITFAALRFESPRAEDSSPIWRC